MFSWEILQHFLSLSLILFLPVLPGELFHQHFSFAALGCFCLRVCVYECGLPCAKLAIFSPPAPRELPNPWMYYSPTGRWTR